MRGLPQLLQGFLGLALALGEQLGRLVRAGGHGLAGQLATGSAPELGYCAQGRHVLCQDA